MSMNIDSIRSPELRNFITRRLNKTGRFIDLGAPIVATTNRHVVSTNMKVGAYTIANQPDVPRNITVTTTQVGGVDDTLGTIVIVGKDVKGNAITETLTPVNGSTVVGTKAFAVIDSITGVGWVINTGNDTIIVGCGALLGLTEEIFAAANVILGFVGATPIAAPTTAFTPAIGGQTVDLSSGTYNGSKKVYAVAVE